MRKAIPTRPHLRMTMDDPFCRSCEAPITGVANLLGRHTAACFFETGTCQREEILTNRYGVTEARDSPELRPFARLQCSAMSGDDCASRANPSHPRYAVQPRLWDVTLVRTSYASPSNNRRATIYTYVRHRAAGRGTMRLCQHLAEVCKVCIW